MNRLESNVYVLPTTPPDFPGTHWKEIEEGLFQSNAITGYGDDIELNWLRSEPDIIYWAYFTKLSNGKKRYISSGCDDIMDGSKILGF